MNRAVLIISVCITLLLNACVPKPPTVAPGTLPPVSQLQAVDWQQLDGWAEADVTRSLDAFLQSCRVLRHKTGWNDVCQEAAELTGAPNEVLIAFFEQRFIPHRVQNEDGTDTGIITGYYVPEMNGSRIRTERFNTPVYRVPDDLLTIDLRSLYPELEGYRLRGRLEGRRIVPYYSRFELDQDSETLKGNELLWVDDPVELFFLHIQGSGSIRFDNGQNVMINYGDQNGHPYRSIGKLLIDRGEMTRDQMSMQNIRAWARNNPDQTKTLLGENPSYIFFRELPEEMTMPPGSLGVPLTPEVSLAVDPRTIPLGAPVFLATTWPYTPRPLNRLMVAQDTGGAIKGAVRADFFWGLGHEAGALAGRMKQDGKLWVLLPRPSAIPEEQANRPVNAPPGS
ncbi:MAG: MltA domain-containing protein [Desulfuromonadales bacterium]|nr:MltA domain-containing protein [Desulfuromonadales bacterium]